MYPFEAPLARGATPDFRTTDAPMAQPLLLALPPSMRGSLRAPTDGGDASSNGCAIGVWAPRVYGPGKLKFWYSGTLVPKKRLRNG